MPGSPYAVRRRHSLALAALLSTLGFLGWTVLLGVGLACFASRMDAERPFDNTYRLRPLSHAYRWVDLHATGRFEAGGDQVVASSHVTITLLTSDGQAHLKRLRYSDNQLLAADETYLRTGGTPEALTAWIGSLVEEPREGALAADAQELSQQLRLACCGQQPAWDLTRFLWVRD